MTEPRRAARPRQGAAPARPAGALAGGRRPQAWVEPLLDWEEQERARRSLERRLQAAHIGRFKPLCDFDWNWPKRCDRAAVEALMTLDFLKEATNVVVRRPQRRRQVDVGAQHRPPGADPRPHRAVHQRRPVARRTLPRWTAIPPCAAACATTPRRDCW